MRLFQIALQRNAFDQADRLNKQAVAMVARCGDGGQPIAGFIEAVRHSRAEIDPQLKAALALPATQVVAALEQLRVKYPRDAYVTYWLAVHLRQNKEPEKARPLFEEVVAKKMENWVTAWATLELARIAKDAGDTAKAATLAQTAIRLGEEYGNGGQSITKAARSVSLLPNG